MKNVILLLTYDVLAQNVIQGGKRSQKVLD